MDSQSLEALGVGAVLSVGVIAVAFYLLRFRRKRAEELKSGLKDSPELVSDRAFNRIAMARKEVDLLSGQGGDVARATELLQLASRSFDLREYDRAYELAQSAHETLVAVRRQLTRPRSTPVAGPAATSPPAGPTLPAVRSVAAEPPAVEEKRTPLPKNRAESQFQLRILEQELASSRRTGAGSERVQGGEELFQQARAAFDRADFTEAFRLSLKGRRQLGGSVESLAPPKAGAVTPTPAGPGATPRNNDPAVAAERAAAADRCPECGHPTLPGDAFCRGCGTSRTPKACSNCGAERLPTDSFCGKCGRSFV